MPYARIQSVRVRQGPLQRLLGLASVHVDSPRGPVHLVLVHRDAAAVPALLAELVDRARTGRGLGVPDRWMVPGAVDVPPTAGEVVLTAGEVVLTAGEVVLTAGEVALTAGEVIVTAGDVPPLTGGAAPDR